MKALKVSAARVDARGRACPWPIVELAKALKSNGEVELWADDPAAKVDLLAFCEATGAKVVAVDLEGAVLKALVLR